MTLPIYDTKYFRQLTPSSNVQVSSDNINFVDVPSWPLNIINPPARPSGQYIQLIFTTDITLTSNTQYFTCDTNYILFGSLSLNNDGSRPKIIIKDLVDYRGVIDNADLNNNIIIANIIVEANNSTLGQYGGWVARRYFGGIDSWIINCSSNGDIPYYAGGISGAYTASFNTDRVYIYGCTSSGQITGSGGTNDGAGGIVGSESGSNGGVITINECSSIGNISLKCGGIAGSASGIFGGTCTITKCYSIGDIIGTEAGGICGYNCGVGGAITMSYCYSRGNIIGGFSGGIVGNFINPGNSVVEYSYSTGNILGNMSGGIYATGDTSRFARNCYTSGFLDIGAGAGGGIYGNDTNDNAYGINNFSEATHGNGGQWIDSSVSPVMGSVIYWISEILNEPYIYRTILYTPYVLTNISVIVNAPLTFNFSVGIGFNVVQGSSTEPSVLAPGYTYNIVQINNILYNSSEFQSNFIMNNTTGQVSVTSSTPPGYYELIIKNSINPYNVSLLNLTVTSEEPEIISEPLVVPPCCQYVNCIRNSPTVNKSNEAQSTYITGKTIIGNVDRYYDAIQTGRKTYFTEPVFKSYREYMIYLQTKNIKQ